MDLKKWLRQMRGLTEGDSENYPSKNKNSYSILSRRKRVSVPLERYSKSNTHMTKTIWKKLKKYKYYIGFLLSIFLFYRGTFKSLTSYENQFPENQTFHQRNLSEESVIMVIQDSNFVRTIKEVQSLIESRVHVEQKIEIKAEQLKRVQLDLTEFMSKNRLTNKVGMTKLQSQMLEAYQKRCEDRQTEALEYRNKYYFYKKQLDDLVKKLPLNERELLMSHLIELKKNPPSEYAGDFLNRWNYQIDLLESELLNSEV